MKKNEIFTEDMVKILETYHQYAPVKDEEQFKILRGGDGLTTKLGLDAQYAHADVPTTSDSLEGTIMKSEDLHEGILFLQVFTNSMHF